MKTKNIYTEFDLNGQSIRVQLDASGMLWFVAEDIAKSLKTIPSQSKWSTYGDQ